MSEMIERVARAICKARGDDPDARGPAVWQSGFYPDHLFARWRSYEGLARAAIAEMREPTEAMVAAGGREVQIDYENGREADRVTDATNCWQAMIDAALNDNAEVTDSSGCVFRDLGVKKP